MQKTTKEVNKKESKNLNSKSTSVSNNATSKIVSKKSATKSSSKNTTKRAPASKTKNTISKKTPSKKPISKTKVSKPIDILEYYDLPYRYNQTIVKILAQTPKTLFVYWDISDNDRKKYIKQYGNDFFEKTKPVLVINNKTMNYTFEIEINDFANCWYFNINDEKCEYLVELGRRPKENTMQLPNNYLQITSSNKIESPNGHILFEKEQNVVFFKNVKTNETFSKDVTKVDFIKYLGKAYKMQEIYKKIYKDEDLSSIVNPSSTFN